MARANGRKTSRRIYISADFEGAACVVGAIGRPLESGLNNTSEIFRQAQRLVTAEVNAAVRGALAGGATEVIVEDAHGCGHSLLYEELHPAAKVLLGLPRPRRFCPLDESFSGIVLLCYHAMAGVRNGILSHSYSSEAVHRMLLNGRAVGEMAMDAAFAGELGVPLIFVSSDEAGCAEARRFFGSGLESVATKRGYSRNCALSLSPRRAQELTEAGMARAVKNAHRCKPYVLKGPHVLERVFKWESQADAAEAQPGAERVDAYRVRWRGKTIFDLMAK